MAPAETIPRRGAPDIDRSIWGRRAEQLLRQALDEVLSDVDALASVGAAEAALRIQAGELPEGELEGFPFPGEEERPECTCPPALVARGGFRSSCLACADFPV
jgi:hypothetical protein